MRLYSDDFGYSREADDGIIKLIKEKKLFGASVLSTMVSSGSLRNLRRSLNWKRNFILGLHINLIEGKPIQHFLNINTLVDQNGKFFPLLILLIKIFLGKIDEAQIRSEVEAQLKKLYEKGLAVKMLDSHQHTHAFSPVAEIVVAVARAHRIPLVRSFRSVKTYSLKARITFSLVKALAFLSYLAAYKKIGMPATWGVKSAFKWTVMSWEDNNFESESIKDKRAAFIIHPYLPYDTNRSYIRFIK